MKCMPATLCLLLCYVCVNAQRSFLQTSSKKRNAWYVDVTANPVMAYKMGVFYDKAATAPAINTTDTLLLQPDGSYVGKEVKIIKNDGHSVLLTGDRKKDRHRLVAVEDPVVVMARLNEAWYLRQYFIMTDTINRAFPMGHHSFRDGFYTWETLPFKEMDYLSFREVAGRYLQAVEDSVRLVHNAYTATAAYISQHINEVEYNVLKEKMTQLPPLEQYEGVGWYRGVMMKEIAQQKPEYFWKLAQDFPEKRDLVFWVVRRDKKIMEGLHAVQGYDDMKKEMVRLKKEDKKIAAMATVSTIAGAALIGVIVGALF